MIILLRTCVVWKHLNTSGSYRVKFYKYSSINNNYAHNANWNLFEFRSLCLSWQQKQFFKWKENIFFVKIFGKPVSKCVALFLLRCLPARKRSKVSQNISNLRWYWLLFSMNERIAVGISSRAAFYLFVVTLVGAVFQQFYEVSNSFALVDQLQSKQIFHYIHFCKIISA